MGVKPIDESLHLKDGSISLLRGSQMAILFDNYSWDDDITDEDQTQDQTAGGASVSPSDSFILPSAPYNPPSFEESNLGALNRRMSFMDPVYGSNAPVMVPPKSRFRDAMFLAGRTLAAMDQTPNASPIAKGIGVLAAALLGAWKGNNVGGRALAEQKNAELRAKGQQEWQDMMRAIAARKAAEQLNQEVIQTQQMPTQLQQQQDIRAAQLDAIKAQTQQRESSALYNLTRAQDAQNKTNQQLLLGSLSAISNSIKSGQDPTYMVHTLNSELARRGLPSIPVPDGMVLRRVFQNGAGQYVFLYTTPDNSNVDQVVVTPNQDWTNLMIQRQQSEINKANARANEAQTRSDLNRARADESKIRAQRLQQGGDKGNKPSPRQMIDRILNQ